MWAVVARFRRLFAVPAAVLVAGVLIAATTHLPPGVLDGWLPHPVFAVPQFSTAGLVGVALPLFLVTMASQNLAGMSVMRLHGCRTPGSADPA